MGKGGTGVVPGGSGADQLSIYKGGGAVELEEAPEKGEATAR